MLFAAVATGLHSGSEVWLRTGSTADAVRASMALPGLFTPVAQRDGRLLVDGGLVNPVPVSLARAMGADIVIAVDLNADILGRHLRWPWRQRRGQDADAVPEDDDPRAAAGCSACRTLALHPMLPAARCARVPTPSLLDVVLASVNIMQVRITRSRMAGDPPEVVVAPALANLGLLDFHRASEAIEEGRRAAKASMPQLRRFMG
jgi:NTE family protein